jgi:lysophospholipase L1-like esterase
MKRAIKVLRRKNQIVAVFTFLLTISLHGHAQKLEQPAVPKVVVTTNEKTLNTQWQGKRVAFLGDSMTDERRVGTTCVYWEYLSELLGLQPFVYGVNGAQWNGIYQQAVKLYQERGNNIDAILIFAGTNDYNAGIPLGIFFSETPKQTNSNGNTVTRKYRRPIINDSTFCGRINKVMSYLKDHFPQQQIILMTPIHRGFAQFGPKNIQPDENFSNGQGLYLDAYVETLKQAASYWAVPLIDLHSISGLFPLAKSQLQYFHNAETDQLHPNALGDYRLAKTIQYQLLTYPSTFVLK